MSAVLLCLAGALALWPGRPVVRRRRLAALGRDAAAATALLDRLGSVRAPLLAGPAAALTGAVLSTPLVAVLAGGCAVLTARGWAAGRRGGRERARVVAVSEGLGALAAELRAGRSVGEATRTAAAACGDEDCGRRLTRAVRAPAAPAPGPPDALTAALGRISAAVLLSSRTGCSLADVVGAVEDDLRARSRHAQELRSATAGPRAGALLLAGLPALGLAMGAGVGADPWGVLTTTVPGQVLLVAGIALEVAGVVWSGRLVRRALR